MSLATALTPDTKPKQQVTPTTKAGLAKVMFQDKLKFYQRQLEISLKEAQDAEDELKSTLMRAEKVLKQFHSFTHFNSRHFVRLILFNNMI